jgi:hypothetical protein
VVGLFRLHSMSFHPRSMSLRPRDGSFRVRPRPFRPAPATLPLMSTDAHPPDAAIRPVLRGSS